MSSPQVIVLSEAEEAVLAARARSVRTEHRDRVRARIVLGAAAGRANTRIAAEVGVCTDTVRTWSRRFATDRLAGLKDAPRSGRPPLFTGAPGPRWLRWRARCRLRPGCRCRPGVARNWPANWPSGAMSRSRRPRTQVAGS